MNAESKKVPKQINMKGGAQTAQRTTLQAMEDVIILKSKKKLLGNMLKTTHPERNSEEQCVMK